MARHSRSLPPTELTIFGYLAAGTVTVADIGALMSQINRRTFRQGMQYAVAKVEFYTVGAEIVVGRLPHHWPSVNAWTKTMALWKQQQDDRLEQSGLEQTVAAHRDFKIFIDGDHANGAYLDLQAVTVQNAGLGIEENYMTLAEGQAISPTVDLDWDKSQVVFPNFGAPGVTVEYNLHMLGDDVPFVSKGMIKAYAESRNRPMQTDPNIVDVPLGGMFGSMFDVGDDSGDIITNAQEANTALPYLNDVDTALEFYPGGSQTGSGVTLVDTLSIVAGSNRTLASSTTGPFLANCGLLLLANNGDNITGVRITLMPGDYKGVMARPMQDVNN